MHKQPGSIPRQNATTNEYIAAYAQQVPSGCSMSEVNFMHNADTGISKVNRKPGPSSHQLNPNMHRQGNVHYTMGSSGGSVEDRDILDGNGTVPKPISEENPAWTHLIQSVAAQKETKKVAKKKKENTMYLPLKRSIRREENGTDQV